MIAPLSPPPTRRRPGSALAAARQMVAETFLDERKIAAERRQRRLRLGLWTAGMLAALGVLGLALFL